MHKMNTWWKALLFGFLFVIGYKIIDNFSTILRYVRILYDILTPFIIGGVIAFFLHKPVARLSGWIQKAPLRFLQKRAMPLAIVGVYAILLLFIAFVLRYLVAAIYENIADIIANWDMISARAMDVFNSVNIPQKQEWLDKANVFLTNLLESEVLLKAGNIVGGVANSVISAFTGFIISIYIIVEKESLKKMVKRGIGLFLPPIRAAKCKYYTRRLADMFYSYFTGLAVDAVLIGAISTIFYIIYDAPYAWLLGLIVAIGNMIPFFGPIIAALIIALVCLVALGPMQALWVLVFQVLLGQLDGNVIQPRILGNSVGISPFWVIFAVLLFGGLWGPMGMLLGVPVVAAIRMVVMEPMSFAAEPEPELPPDNENVQ